MTLPVWVLSEDRLKEDFASLRDELTQNSSIYLIRMSEEKHLTIYKCTQCKGEGLKEWFINDKGKLSKWCLHCRNNEKIRYVKRRPLTKLYDQTPYRRLCKDIANLKYHTKLINSVNIETEGWCDYNHHKVPLKDIFEWNENNKKCCKPCLDITKERRNNKDHLIIFKSAEEMKINNEINVNDAVNYNQMRRCKRRNCGKLKSILEFSKRESGEYKLWCNSCLDYDRQYKRKQRKDKLKTKLVGNTQPIY